MYQFSEYTATNNLGTANLFQAIIDTRAQPEKIVVASSMSIYGEGKYLCAECGEVAPSARPLSQMKAQPWETVCPNCGQALFPVPTREDKPLDCTSIYALSKKDQEEMTLLFRTLHQQWLFRRSLPLLLQYIRDTTVAFESLHGSCRHLCLAADEW